MTDRINVADGPEKDQVAAIRATLLTGLASVEMFAAATNRSTRCIYLWIDAGLPVLHIGKTPYIPVSEAKKWLLQPRPKASRARQRTQATT